MKYESEDKAKKTNRKDGANDLPITQGSRTCLDLRKTKWTSAMCKPDTKVIRLIWPITWNNSSPCAAKQTPCTLDLIVNQP